MDAMSVTALDYLAAEDEAKRDAYAMVSLRRLRSEINRYPRTQERLALEFLGMASAAIQRREDPGRVAFLGFVFAARLRGSASPTISERIEDLVVLTFETMAGLRSSGLAQILSSGLTCLRSLDGGRFRRVLSELQRRAGNDPSQVRRAILSEAAETEPQKRKRIRELHRASELQRLSMEWRLRSGSN